MLPSSSRAGFGAWSSCKGVLVVCESVGRGGAEIKTLHLERQPKTACYTHTDINPPHPPRHICSRATPRGHANGNEHVDQRGETHGQCAYEERLRWVSQHQRPRCRIQGVSENRDDEDNDEDDGV